MKRVIGLLSLLAIASPSLAAQQSTASPIEIGMDAELAHTERHQGNIQSGLTVFAVPVGDFRIGFPATPQLSFEPSISYFHFSGSGSGSSYTFDLGLVYSFTANRAEPQWFVRPLVGYEHAPLFGVGGDHWALGVGGGVRIPIADRIAFRTEARYRRSLEHANVWGQHFGLLAGLSFFTH